ncbi:hypothetical protein L1987_52830 [Smallanthus sonchifolius]|uniref:Uncharacterized protein n=1 Tax=Smallanthus sonchifolius TaxID=185202 RepID=A0ACB9EUI8_9ASTR|nr:hypothetical protein L1987_52830 [Smallanthus sonchifolius]
MLGPVVEKIESEKKTEIPMVYGVVEDVKEEDDHNEEDDSDDDEDEKEDDAQGGSETSKQSRSEKKSRNAMLKLGMKLVLGVSMLKEIDGRRFKYFKVQRISRLELLSNETDEQAVYSFFLLFFFLFNP